MTSILINEYCKHTQKDLLLKSKEISPWMQGNRYFVFFFPFLGLTYFNVSMPLGSFHDSYPATFFYRPFLE